MTILTIDTEPLTVTALRAAGHTVYDMTFGYRDGRRYCSIAPHDVDAIVFDLQTPACYDMERWGPYGGNDNYKCTIVAPSELTWETKRVGTAGNAYDRLRYQLIRDTQIDGMAPYSSPFGPPDVRRAVEAAGVPLLIFLNPAWVLRTGGFEFPNIVDLRWSTRAIHSEKIISRPPLEPMLATMPSFFPRLPVSCAITDGPSILRSNRPAGTKTTIITDRIGSVLGQFVELSAGNIWLLPETANNGVAAAEFLAVLQPAIPTGAPVIEASMGNTADEKYDVFISHAHEDKETFVEPLARFLRERGIKVWYDRFVLKPGDSLSKTIEVGLARSPYGVLVLSQSFFAKRWPETEYRTLLALGRRIIPVWHGVSREDVARYSPILLDIFAIDSKHGVESAGRQIITVVRPDLADTVPAETAPVLTRLEEYDLAPYHVGDPGVPVDAVPWQPFVAATQPCLDVRFGEPNVVDLGQKGRRWAMSITVANVGAGAAREVRLFFPYVDVTNVDLITPGSEHRAGTFLDDRYAFSNFVKFPAQTVFEYEDISGFLYRQYGTIDQSAVPSGAFYRFSLREIGKPFRVKSRIVKDFVPEAWLIGQPKEDTQ